MSLSSPDHRHHARARRYWEEEADDTQAFCRVTTLALLRHLTNPRVMGSLAMTGGEAWDALHIWLAQPCVELLPEPMNLDEWLGSWDQSLEVRGGGWTDAYLAAFAAASGCRLVTFDEGFVRYPNLELLHLRA